MLTHQLLETIRQRSSVCSLRLVAGFDGAIDTLVRVVQSTASDGSPLRFFETIPDFGHYLVGQAGVSGSVELQLIQRKAGGNAPLLSAAAAALGMQSSCIGMLGDNQVDGVFRNIPGDNIGFMPPMEATALEFRDGKIFLCPSVQNQPDPWSLICAAEDGRAADLLAQADVLALVNWSELPFSSRLWQSCLAQCIAASPPDHSRFVFFDLSDCQRKSRQQTLEVLQLIGQFSRYRTTILSLNENEACVLARRIGGADLSLQQVAEKLRNEFGIDEILIHTAKQSILCTARGWVSAPSWFVEKPMLLTGAGDNFNAASCVGAALGLSDEQRLVLAHAVTHFYITKGHSPALSELELCPPPLS